MDIEKISATAEIKRKKKVILYLFILMVIDGFISAISTDSTGIIYLTEKSFLDRGERLLMAVT